MVNELDEAIQRDDDEKVLELLISSESEVAINRSMAREENNSLVKALKCGSHKVAEMLATKFPEMAWQKDDGDRTTLHLACQNRHSNITLMLLNIAPELCLVKDNNSAMPLDVAVRNGCDQTVIKALLDRVPNSILMLTPEGETVFHLALKHGHCDLFPFLVETSKSLQFEHLLHKKDGQGNAVLHIATSKKLIEPLKLLLPPKASGRVALVRVNSLNGNGLTAYDIYNRSDKCSGAQVIKNILRNAGAMEASSSPKVSSGTDQQFLTVLGILYTMPVAVLCNPPDWITKDVPPKGTIFYPRDIIFFRLPISFYLLILIILLALSLVKGLIFISSSLPRHCRTTVFYGAFIVAIFYGFLVHGLTPKFHVRFCKGIDIVSSGAIGILTLASACLVLVAHQMVNYILLLGKRFGGRIVNYRRPRGDEDILHLIC